MTDHPETRQLIEFDSLDERARTALLLHVRDCSRCRAVWAAADPTRQFAALRLAPLDPAVLDRLSAGIDRGIEGEQARRRRGRLYGVASIAASLLLAAVVGGFLWRGDVAPPPGTAALQGAGALRDDTWSGVELVASPGDEARVVDLTIGETRVVMIFDEALDL